ncbi:MAG TPA: HlyD family efflux transporter periplasmic adaptor subunit, partial [Polyangiaceae bacterium]|nr:HlyD family efflux transporter periplasmic adaptor subunit [Polyangiaceae bacterium]
MLIALAAISILGFGAYLALPTMRNWSRAQASADASGIRTATVVTGDIVRDAPAQGRIVAARHPTLYSPSSGLVNLLVRAGATVEKGAPLARIDSPELRSKLAQEKSTLEVLRSAAGRQRLATRELSLRGEQSVALFDVKFTAAKRQLERAQRAFDEGVLSKLDLEKAKDDLKIAELEVSHARSTSGLQQEIAAFDLRDKTLQVERQATVVEELERLVSGLVVAAPFDGVVATIQVADRDAVQQNTPLLTVVDLTANEIEMSLADGYASDAVPGTKAEILYEGRTVEGHVTTVSPEVRDGLVKGTVVFEEPPPGLKQGQRVSIRLIFETRTQVLKLPRGPFVDSGGGRFAYVVEGGMAS